MQEEWNEIGFDQNEWCQEGLKQGHVACDIILTLIEIAAFDDLLKIRFCVMIYFAQLANIIGKITKFTWSIACTHGEIEVLTWTKFLNND